MNIELTDEKRGKIYLTQEVPDELSVLLLSNAIPYALNEETYTALFQLIPGDGFSIWHSTFNIGEEQVVLKANGDVPALELRIAIRNCIEGTWENILQPALPEFYFNLGFTPTIATRAVFQRRTEYATIDFHFDIPFLEELGVSFRELDTFLKRVNDDQPAELSPYPHPCPPEMKDAVKAILHNKYRDSSKQFLNKWKAGEILLSALETVGRAELLMPLPLKELDIKKLMKAREIIDAYFPEWIGLKAICTKSELNQLKLKIGFKHLFNQTPYRYYQDLKLKEAKRLLLEGKESISSIAYLAGYNHPSSFSREFRKVFGYSPKDIFTDGQY